MQLILALMSLTAQKSLELHSIHHEEEHHLEELSQLMPCSEDLFSLLEGLEDCE